MQAPVSMEQALIQPIDTIYYTLVDEDLNTCTTTKQTHHIN